MFELIQHGKITELLIPKTGEVVGYTFIRDYENVNKFLNAEGFLHFDSGKGIVAYGKNSELKEGTFYIGFYNDNKFQGIDVDVKVVAIKEVKTFDFIEYERDEPIIVTLNKTRMEVKETKIRVPVE